MTNILITGASSGIGAALARRCAAPHVTLGLIARDRSRLDRAAQDARAAGATCVTDVADVRDRTEISRAVEAFDAAHPIDMLIVNAGVFDGRRADETVESLDASLGVIDVNLAGALATLHAALPGMRRRKRGRVVLVASLAGLSPLAGALGYSAAKSALVAYGLGLRQALWDEGIEVSVVCPGFVETGISSHYVGRRLFTLTADEAAEKLLRGVARRRAVVAFPWALHLLARPSILAPDVVRRAFGRIFACHDAGVARTTGGEVVVPATAANDPTQRGGRAAG